MVDLKELIDFQNTNFMGEQKEEWIKFRLSKSQKKAVKTMARARNMTISQLIMSLLQYEKDTGVILNEVLERQFLNT